MCAARVLKNDTYKPADFFFAAAICLFNRGLLGGKLERRYKKSSAIIHDWHADAIKLAAHVGLCKKVYASNVYVFFFAPRLGSRAKCLEGQDGE